MKLVEKNPTNWIAAKEMRDGQIAIVRKWANTTPLNKIIQRNGTKLIVLGEGSGSDYSGIDGWNNCSECLVEILPVGSLLEI